MSEAQSFVCPTCGAPLEIHGNESQIKCEFCGNVVVVPEHLRVHPLREPQMERPVIMVQLPPVTRLAESDLAFPMSPERRRSGGCFARLFALVIILFVVGLTTFPFVLTDAALRDRLVGAISSAVGQSFAPPTATRRPVVAVPISTNTPSSLARDTGNVIGTSTPTPPLLAPTSVPDSAGLVFGGDGAGPGLFKDPRYIAIDGKGSLYVSDFETGRIQHLDANGKYLNGWTLDGKKPIVTAMTADRTGNVYVVVNLSMNNILKYEGSTGKLLGTLTGSNDRFEAITPLADGRLQAIVTHNSTSDDLLRLTPDGKVSNRVPKAVSTQTDSTPIDLHVAVDGLGNIYVLSPFDYAVLKYSSSGKYMNQFGQKGDGPDQFKAFQEAIAVDGKGNVYISDFKGIMIFDASGRYLNLIKVAPSATRSMVFNDQNKLYVLMSNATVVKLNPAGGAQ